MSSNRCYRCLKSSKINYWPIRLKRIRLNLRISSLMIANSPKSLNQKRGRWPLHHRHMIWIQLSNWWCTLRLPLSPVLSVRPSQTKQALMFHPLQNLWSRRRAQRLSIDSYRPRTPWARQPSNLRTKIWGVKSPCSSTWTWCNLWSCCRSISSNRRKIRSLVRCRHRSHRNGPRLKSSYRQLQEWHRILCVCRWRV